MSKHTSDAIGAHYGLSPIEVFVQARSQYHTAVLGMAGLFTLSRPPSVPIKKRQGLFTCHAQ